MTERWSGQGGNWNKVGLVMVGGLVLVIGGSEGTER